MIKGQITFNRDKKQEIYSFGSLRRKSPRLIELPPIVTDAYMEF